MTTFIHLNGWLVHTKAEIDCCTYYGNTCFLCFILSCGKKFHESTPLHQPQCAFQVKIKISMQSIIILWFDLELDWISVFGKSEVNIPLGKLVIGEFLRTKLKCHSYRRIWIYRNVSFLNIFNERIDSFLGLIWEPRLIYHFWNNLHFNEPIYIERNWGTSLNHIPILLNLPCFERFRQCPEALCSSVSPFARSQEANTFHICDIFVRNGMSGIFKWTKWNEYIGMLLEKTTTSSMRNEAAHPPSKSIQWTHKSN